MMRDKASGYQRRAVTLFASAVLLCALPACSSSDSSTDPSANRGTSNSSDTSSSDLGKIQLEFASPVELQDATITFVKLRDGRPNVVHVSNYGLGEPDRNYPAVYFHGTTDVASSRALPGKTVEFVMYYQESKDSMIATNRPGESVRLSFQQTGVGRKLLSIDIQGVELVSADDQTIPLSGGKITAFAYDWNP